MTIPADLDAWTAALATAVGIPATRDPDKIFPPCLFVDLPPVTAATLPAITLDVPVWLVGSGTGKSASDAVLGLLPATLGYCHSKSANPAMLTVGGQDFHGYQTTAQLRLLLDDPPPPVVPGPHNPEATLTVDLYDLHFVRLSHDPVLDDLGVHWIRPAMAATPGPNGEVLADTDALRATNAAAVWIDHGGNLGHVKTNTGEDLSARNLARYIDEGRTMEVQLDLTTDPPHPTLTVLATRLPATH